MHPCFGVVCDFGLRACLHHLFSFPFMCTIIFYDVRLALVKQVYYGRSATSAACGGSFPHHFLFLNVVGGPARTTPTLNRAVSQKPDVVKESR